MKEEILRLDHVTWIEDGAARLDNLSLHVFRGEIMGLLSLNDYGVEELVQLLCQNLPLHYGYVYLQEQLVNSYQNSSFSLNRVSLIEKQSRLVEDLTVADNIFVLRHGFKKFLIDPKALRQQLQRFTADLPFDIDADKKVLYLTNYERCVVELLKAVIGGTKLVIVRDLSNSLSAADLSRFHRLMRHYVDRGVSFLYICSHHEEAFTVCDRLALMSNGRVVLTMEKPFLSDEAIWQHSLDFTVPEAQLQKKEESAEAVRFRRVCTENLRELSFSVRQGECVVLLDHSNTILKDVLALMGREKKPFSGEITVNGMPFGKKHVRAQPVALIQEDPVRTMLYPEMTCLDNLCFLMDEKDPSIWRSYALRNNIAEEYERYLGPAIYERDIENLSYRELYDLIYYRVHLYRPSVVFCMQPFFGADMYLRHHIISLIGDLCRKKIAVVLLSVNISDSLSIADRLIVVENGRFVQEYRRENFKNLSKQEGYDPHRDRG